MSWGLVAVGVGTAVAGVAGIAGAKEQGKGLSAAASTEERVAQQNIAAQEKQLERIIGLQEPFREAGIGALPQLAEIATGGGAPIRVEDLPTFGIQQEEGEQAINRALAGRGIFGSRAGVDALSDFNRKLLATETGAESNRRFGRLLDLVNIGRGATTGQSSAISSTAANIGNINQQSGSRLADLQIAQGQNRGSTFANIGALPLQALSLPGVQDRLFPGGS